MERILLKLSGESLKGKELPVNIEFIHKLVLEIKELSKTYSIGIVLGGGNFMRGRDAKEIGIPQERIDYIGMMGTIMNSIYLEEALKKEGVKAKALSCLNIPAAIDSYSIEAADSLLNEGYVCIFAGGTGKPFYSTDTAAALRTKELNFSKILMGKQGCNGVYSADPNKDKNAVKYDILNLEDIIEKNLQVIDLAAAKVLLETNCSLFVFDINEENSIVRASKNQIEGTIVKRR